MSPGEPGQPTLFGPAARRRRAVPAAPAPNETGPVAAVAVDVPLPHLDHPFSYAVPAALAATVRPGARVQVPFAGRTEDGWVLDVADGPLSGLRPLRRLVTPVPPLTDEVAALARAVADATAGTLVDVLRAAVPPRHAASEKAFLASSSPDGAAADVPSGTGGTVATVDPGPWTACVGGEAFLRRTAAGQGPLAAVRLPLDVDPWQAVLVAVRAALASDRDAVVVLPEVGDVEACDAVLRAGLDDPSQLALLHSGLGPTVRWREFLRLRTGRARVALGTRSAVFAPVGRPGLVLVWDEGDDGHVEPHSPGWDSAAVALQRAEAAGAGLALLGRARPVRTQHWVRTGWVKDIAPDRARRRAGAPRVVVPDPADPLEVHARVPRAAHRVAAEALQTGPVLVQVPRSGYATALQCRRCRHAARCPVCAGPLGLTGSTGAMVCRWCARPAPAWECPECGGRHVRAGVVGVVRSAEEWGRAFPGTPVALSHAGHRAAAVDGAPRVVVA
ncbi:primosomal protein N', partial [Aquipuribacter hungaricus]